MDRVYMYWRQNEPRFNQTEAWPRRLFPEAEYTFFRDAGCLVFALAVMLRHHGVEKTADESRFNPWILNQKLISCGAFDSAADLDLSFINRIYPLEYLGSVDYSKGALDEMMEKNLPCLVTVPGINANRHFTTLLSMLPHATVFDPVCGEKSLSTYDKIFEIRIFQPAEMNPISSKDGFPVLQML